MPDEPAADEDEDEAAGAEEDAEDVVELEFEPHPAMTSAPSIAAAVKKRRNDLAGVAVPIVVLSVVLNRSISENKTLNGRIPSAPAPGDAETGGKRKISRR